MRGEGFGGGCEFCLYFTTKLITDPELKTPIDRFLAVLSALAEEGVDYILIGGFAVALHGSGRTTEDIDILIRNKEENVAKLRKALNSVFNDSSIQEITTSELKNYPVIRFIGDEKVYIDIIANLGEAFSIENIQYEEVELDGVTIRLATAESLFRMKEKTYRAVDLQDLTFLSDKIKNEKQ